MMHRLSYVIHGKEMFLLKSMGDTFPASKAWGEASIDKKYLKWANISNQKPHVYFP